MSTNTPTTDRGSAPHVDVEPAVALVLAQAVRDYAEQLAWERMQIVTALQGDVFTYTVTVPNRSNPSNA